MKLVLCCRSKVGRAWVFISFTRLCGCSSWSKCESLGCHVFRWLSICKERISRSFAAEKLSNIRVCSCFWALTRHITLQRRSETARSKVHRLIRNIVTSLLHAVWVLDRCLSIWWGEQRRCKCEPFWVLSLAEPPYLFWQQVVCIH